MGYALFAHSLSMHAASTTEEPVHLPGGWVGAAARWENDHRWSTSPIDGLDPAQEDLFASLPDDSVDIVYDNYGAEGTADRAMRTIRPGGMYLMSATSGIRTRAPGSTQVGRRAAAAKVCSGSHVLWLTVALAHTCCGSHVLWLTRAVAHSCTGSHLLWLTRAVAYACCGSQLHWLTLAVAHTCCG
jgi:hypothetical protein